MAALAVPWVEPDLYTSATTKSSYAAYELGTFHLPAMRP